MADDRDAPPAFRRTGRTLGIAWLALLALMLASLGSAYLKLGPWNMVAGLVIAAIKAAIVAWLFMRLRESGPLIRLVAVVGLGVWFILLALSGVDYGTRHLTPAAAQSPQQLRHQWISRRTGSRASIMVDRMQIARCASICRHPAYPAVTPCIRRWLE